MCSEYNPDMQKCGTIINKRLCCEIKVFLKLLLFKKNASLMCAANNITFNTNNYNLKNNNQTLKKFIGVKEGEN